ncbi:MAG: PaaI family thioesterase [Actinomycetota bacterium]|nr:PaaI family thioesterase [Actinomycetota bacterium]MDA3013789.1 PaaI family thioesterase [Actinomycetota bacterium]
MNERRYQWELSEKALDQLVNLDKTERRKFFLNFPLLNVPMGALMGFSKISIDELGQVSFSVTPEEFHYNPLGTVHGGLAATILDSCNSISANCQLNKGFLTMTTDIRVNYLRPMNKDTGEVTATAIIEKIGRKVIFVRGVLEDANKKIFATAYSTEMVVEI